MARNKLHKKMFYNGYYKDIFGEKWYKEEQKKLNRSYNRHRAKQK